MIVIHKIEVLAELVQADHEGMRVSSPAPVLVEIAFWNPQPQQRSGPQETNFGYYLPRSSNP
jgi:hypothetical protein